MVRDPREQSLSYFFKTSAWRKEYFKFYKNIAIQPILFVKESYILEKITVLLMTLSNPRPSAEVNIVVSELCVVFLTF